jgi:hypothetical protein
MAAGGPANISNGSRLTPEAGLRGDNFLSREIWEVVQSRLGQNEKYQTINPSRLREDLLSSMPMCFNLFGEAAADADRSRRLADYLLPGARPGPVDLRFEWSPERRSRRYTNDRTAFDAALLIGEPGEPQDFVGIETKYHKHSMKEPKPKPAAAARHAEQTEFLAKIAERSGLFAADWRERVLDTDLRQLWRDHLLALSMMENRDLWGRGPYLLVYPARNKSFADAARRYADLLKARDDDDTFRAMTVEQLLDRGVAHAPDTAKRFADRYLW